MMNTIFNESDREHLINRIGLLTENNQRQWGKMSVYQMLEHLIIWNEDILGKTKVIHKQSFIGKIFGKIALKRTIGDKPLDKNIPTSDFHRPKGNSKDMDNLKITCQQLIASYENFSNYDYIHDFFGKMKPEHLGILVYKHHDHHLRQFGV